MRTLDVVGAHDADREGQEQGLVPLGLPPRIKRDRLRGVQRGGTPFAHLSQFGRRVIKNGFLAVWGVQRGNAPLLAG